MSRLSRSVSAVALVAGVAGAMLVGAAPAQAAGTLTASQYCESIRNSIFCEAIVAGGTAPYTIKWHYNGYYFPQHDNKTYVSWGCQPYTTPQSKIVVTDATGASVTSITNRRCTGGAP
ncbi:hypothetical protein AB0M43_20510 [Longispora sp. NPDC051575]|uniref:hypothetical protein n=1 Tax=Longispora sp. NPDC051575 TaxID=3154943 RepID=UPI0034247F61